MNIAMNAYSSKAAVCIFMALFFLFCVPPSGRADSKPIVVVHSYHKEFKWVKEVNKGIADYLEGRNLFGIKTDPNFSGRQVRYFYMNAKEHAKDEKYLAMKGAEIISELNSIKPVVTIVSDDEALKYVAVPLRDDPSQKFVFLGVNNDPREYGAVSNHASPEYNITGLISEHPFVYSVRLVTEIFANAKNIYIFFDDSMSGNGIYSNLQRDIKQLDIKARKMVRKTIVSNDWATWKNVMTSNQKKDNVFIVGTFYSLHDPQGRYVSEKEVIDWIVSHSIVPELTVISSHISDGLLLSISNPGYVHGYEACTLASSVAAGTPISKIPVRTPTQKALHVNMNRAKQVGASIPVDIVAMSQFYDELGY